jgi:predicted nucleic acid-binding protein
MRIRLETDAYYLILSGVQSNKYEMMVSPVHYKEIESIEDIKERIQVIQLLNLYGKTPKYDSGTARNRAIELIECKFGIADAVHLAFAEQSADYFITCDDKLIRRSKKVEIKIKVINPIEFCIREEFK